MPLEEMIWISKCFKCQAAITGCKEYPVVPLIRITGCTGYYPACVLRLYGPLQDITVKRSLERVSLDYFLVEPLAINQARLGQIKALWDSREIKRMYEVDPESRESRKYRATATYIINQMKKSGEIEFQALDILQPVPEYPDP